MKNEKNTMLYAILNTISFIAMITLNALANILPINGKNTGEISDAYPNLFVPAGITFSIWGVIYTLLLLFCIIQIKDALSQKTEAQSPIQKIGIFFILSSLFNGAWILAWHYEQIFLSLAIMLVLLALLMTLYLRLGSGEKSPSKSEKFFIRLPISVYFGWITIATIANFTAFFVSVGWDGWGVSPVIWTCVLLGVGTILTLMILIVKSDIIYSLVVVWAFAGIILKRSATDSSVTLPIIITAGVAITLIIIGMALRFRKWLED